MRVYKVTEVIYDLTYHFTSRYLSKSDRTVDQMVQAARSGKQNIAEGSKASTTSAETEIKLTNVALASLEELLIDYQDYLRVRQLPQWDVTHPRYDAMRKYAAGDHFLKNYMNLLPRLNDQESANLAITLINQATYMLRRLIVSQQDAFIKNGGIREQMTRARIKARNAASDSSDKSDRSDRSDKSDPH